MNRTSLEMLQSGRLWRLQRISNMDGLSPPMRRVAEMELEYFDRAVLSEAARRAEEPAP